MVQIKVKKGLDIPLTNSPKDGIRELEKSPLIGLDLSFFSQIRMRMLVEPSEQVLIGQPLAEDKVVPQRKFISPASGKVREILRGEKKSVATIVIETDGEDKYFEVPVFSYSSKSPQEIATYLHEVGLASHFRRRPFHSFTRFGELPKAIFVKAVESAPYTPSAEMQVEGRELAFQEGLKVLNHIAPNQVHMIFSKNSSSKAFSDAKDVNLHTVEGPHPSSNTSIHIEKIHPIETLEDVIWTVNVLDVLCLGFWFLEKRYVTDRIVSLAGPEIKPEACGFYKSQMGCLASHILEGKTLSEAMRIVSGNPLMGSKIDKEGFLGFSDTVFCAFSHEFTREFLHFFRPGKDKYTATKTYLSGLLKKKYFFNTNQHGEGRAFLDAGVYDKVMPMKIPTMQLIKSVLADDFETAVKLGVLEIAPEDFALPTFICPSKIEMVEIIKAALKKYSEETTI